jgi:hypothetical protein
MLNVPEFAVGRKRASPKNVWKSPDSAARLITTI